MRSVRETLTQKYTIATVVKVLGGYAWFDRMREGVKKFGEDTGHKTSLLGPPKADEYLQLQIIEDLIAQHVDALCVVPIFPQALEMALRKVRTQGIIVISHEASNQRNVDYDIEAFDNSAYGAHLMDHLAKYMGEEGEYAAFVGHVNSRTHCEWIDAAIARQKKKYPRMNLAIRRIEDHDDQTIAYEKTIELLKTCPNLKGIVGSAMSTVPGASQAIEGKGLQNKVAVVGSCLVSACKQYLTSGAVKLISFWDPADAGYVMNKLAIMRLEGKKITEGMDLGVPGYNKIKIKGKIIYGAAWVDVTRENMTRYNF